MNLMAGMTVKMDDEDPDYPALTMGGMVLGGSANSRLFQRIRVKDGLSYGANSQFYLPAKDDGGAAADFDALLQIVSAISPVPGGVGPMTITMLLHNTVRAARLQQKALS